jgi:hypothetical protein
MPSIAATATAVLAKPRPVLCLDTCELLAAVQCLRQRYVVHVEALTRLVTSVISNPDRVLVVITDLVVHEWRQNIAGVQSKAQAFLTYVDQDSGIVHDAWAHLGRPLATSASTHAASSLIAELTTLAQGVINLAWVLDREPVCVDRALGRVLSKTRPSQEGCIKDSIHLEHYLELSRQLHAVGFGERRVFVSANKNDFWESAPPTRIHSSLAPEFAAVGLEFFGDLRSAVGSLRI